MSLPGDPVYSNRLTKGVVDFIDAHFGKALTDEVLARVGLDRFKLNDMSGYGSQEETHVLMLAAMELTGEKRLAYMVGKDMPRSLGKLGGYIIGGTSPAFFMKALSQIEQRIAKKTLNRTEQIGPGKYRVEITFREGFREHWYVCENRIGCYEGAPLIFGLPYAKVDHPQCLHRGEGNCVYLVEFPESGYLSLKRFALLLGLVCAGTTGYAAAVWRGPVSLVLPLSAAAATLALYSAYKHLNAKASLRWSILLNESLATQSALLERMTIRMSEFYKLVAGLGECGDRAEACDRVTAHLVKELGFGSSQVWLAVGAPPVLKCVSMEGFAEKARALSRSAEFGLAQESAADGSLLGQAVRQRTPVIVEAVADILPRISPAAADYVKALGYSSFILTPMFDGPRPVGLLVGGYHKGEKIDSQDRALFQSLAVTLGAVLVRSTANSGHE